MIRSCACIVAISPHILAAPARTKGADSGARHQRLGIGTSWQVEPLRPVKWMVVAQEVAFGHRDSAVPGREWLPLGLAERGRLAAAPQHRLRRRPVVS